jgi:ring-1,2-phenylacetyl-CoA epoxidase subunit PaaE
MSEFLKFLVKEIIPETKDVFTMVLAPPTDKAISYRAGQFLTLLFEINGKELRRSYSISSSPDVDDNISITVKRQVNGEVSAYIHRYLKPGMVVTSLHPAGRFMPEIHPDIPHDIFLIAAGSGITPIFSILKTLLKNDPASKIILIYSNRSESETIFYTQLNRLTVKYPENFRCIYIFSNPSDKGYAYRAHLNIGLLQQLIRTHLSFQKRHAEFYLCGPFTFMRMADMAIVVMGFEEDNIHKENFLITTEPLPSGFLVIPDKTPKTLKILSGDKITTLTIPYDKTILQAMLDHGIRIPYSCRAGICAACAVICREGKVAMAANDVLTGKDMEHGWVLTCTGYVVTNEAFIEIK